jgi:hypothetical protein
MVHDLSTQKGRNKYVEVMAKKPKIYKIPIIWQAVKTYEVEAENLQEAAQKACKEFFNDNSVGEGYIEDSFEVDGIVEDDYPNEELDYGNIIN